MSNKYEIAQCVRAYLEKEAPSAVGENARGLWDCDRLRSSILTLLEGMSDDLPSAQGLLLYALGNKEDDLAAQLGNLAEAWIQRHQKAMSAWQEFYESTRLLRENAWHGGHEEI